MHERSIELLNNALADELSAVHQYMFFHFHLNDQGYDLLAHFSNAPPFRKWAMWKHWLSEFSF